jgi:hypothetical protein
MQTLEELINDFFKYSESIIKHWGPLISGGLALVIMWGVHEHYGQEVPLWVIWTLIGLSVFFSGFLAWRAEHRKVLTRERKRIIRDGLASLHERGVGLLLECERTPGTITDLEVGDRFAVWDGDGQTYLRENLDRSYVTRFNNPVGLHLQYALLANAERTRIWRHVANRTARLQQFMDDYKDS